MLRIMPKFLHAQISKISKFPTQSNAKIPKFSKIPTFSNTQMLIFLIAQFHILNNQIPNYLNSKCPSTKPF